MATIDLIVLGMLKKEPMSAYDIQKLVEYRNISRWVKISTPSVYKKAIQLEEKGFIKADIIKTGKMPEKTVYTLTDAGEKEFERLMFEIAAKPIHIFLDFNAVIVNLDSLTPDHQKLCVENIEKNVISLKGYLEQNLREKENIPEIPETGMAVLRQQLVLVEAIEKWISSLKIEFSKGRSENGEYPSTAH
ncbi:MAG TPA: PadR family transcriptional regulator [Candidatus Eisenbergiella stercoravium]|nr:PadR family transcriptional regulator [Candidatus Eisenbergiella stercoravium]